MLGKQSMPQAGSCARWIGVVWAALCVGFVAGNSVSARDAAPKVVALLSSSQTIAGETIRYPGGALGKVTAVVLTLQPGEETGMHTHDAPTFGYVLEGELSVDYQDQGTRVYRAGDAVLEAMSVAHNGRNTGAGPMRILAVFMGEAGVPVSVPAGTLFRK